MLLTELDAPGESRAVSANLRISFFIPLLPAPSVRPSLSLALSLSLPVWVWLRQPPPAKSDVSPLRSGSPRVRVRFLF